MPEVRYSFRPGHNRASIAGPRCLDRPVAFELHPTVCAITFCQRSYRSAIFMLCRSCIELSKAPVLEAARPG